MRDILLAFAAGLVVATVIGSHVARPYAEDDYQVRLQTLVNACIQTRVAQVVALSGNSSAPNAWIEVDDNAAVSVCLNRARAKIR
jgi:hypothetical protein